MTRVLGVHVAATIIALIFLAGCGAFDSVLAGHYSSRCDKGIADDCMMSGIYYFHGDGVPKDYLRAASLFEKSYNLGSGGAVTNWLGLSA